MHEHDEYSWWICDGRNIPIAKVCDTCEAEVMAEIRLRYRPEIVDSCYDESDVDEPIDYDY